MTYWERGCCHPTGGPHGRDEPESCCHVHVEDLPSNHSQQGEPPEPPEGWTAQEQNLRDRISAARAAMPEEESEPKQEPEHKRRHTI